MKKILLLVLITLFCIQNVYAECDYNNEVELSKLASKINYDYEYDKEHNTFTYHIYNVNSRLYITNNSMIMKPEEDNKVTIHNVSEGQYLNLPVKSFESCYESLMTLYIIVPYFNEFYNSAECKGYEDKLKICQDEFLSYDPDINILNDAINNYNNSLPTTKLEKKEPKITITDKLETFAKTWGIKIGLSLFTIIVCVAFFQTKIRKIKHGL